MFVDWTTAERPMLDAAISRAPAHLRPAFLAVRDHGCAFVFVAQGCVAFTVPRDRPAVVLIGDDLATSFGPRGFDRASLRRHLSTCRAAAVCASEPVVSIYAEAVN
ncbi:nicotinamide mononucleotide adenylyltransferase [Methylobacterium sp. OAE515]|uniref:hypothetical protein n=1 Tax=Methylobacterium sp. OAE515 TaxID=2817895 RepID=UPI00178B593D